VEQIAYCFMYMLPRSMETCCKEIVNIAHNHRTDVIDTTTGNYADCQIIHWLPIVACVDKHYMLNPSRFLLSSSHINHVAKLGASGVGWLVGSRSPVG